MPHSQVPKEALMDSYKRDTPENAKPKQGTGMLPDPAKKSAGTSSLADSFQSTASMTARLNSGTKRLSGGTSGLGTAKTLEAMKTEIENGNLIIGKLEGRIIVLQRAAAIVERPNEVNQICKGVGSGEANFTKQVAKMLQTDPATLRRVQVALFQWGQAQKGLETASKMYEGAMGHEGAALAQYVESYLHVEKLRGQLYPLINLHVVFRENALLAQLIPTPKTTNEPPPIAPPLPPSNSATTSNLSLTQPGSLADELAAADPSVQEMVTTLKAATGSLKDKLFGFLGGPKKTGDLPPPPAPPESPTGGLPKSSLGLPKKP